MLPFFRKKLKSGVQTVASSVRKPKMVVLGALAVVAESILLPASAAFAQQTTLGGQIQNMSTEFSTTAGFVGSTAMYGAGLICFIAGVWALWQSRSPENREPGRVGMGLAGLVLTGLFVAGGAWINKASMTTTGGAPTISSTAGIVNF